MSPHNVLVGADGTARVLDFGIAKIGARPQEVTRDGQLKGKLSYFPPEQLTHEHAVDRRADVYATAATLWEALTGRRMIQGDNEFQRMTKICSGEIPLPSKLVDVPASLDEAVMKGLARTPDDRYATAREMAVALESTLPPASQRAIGEWVERVAGEAMRERAERIQAIERHSAVLAVSPDDEETLGGPISAVLGSDGRVSGGRLPALRSSRPSMPSWRSQTPAGSLAPPEIEIEGPPRRRRGAWLALLLVMLLAGGAGAMTMGYAPWVASAPAGEKTAPVPAAAATAATAPAVAPPKPAPVVPVVNPSDLPPATPVTAPPVHDFAAPAARAPSAPLAPTVKAPAPSAHAPAPTDAPESALAPPVSSRPAPTGAATHATPAGAGSAAADCEVPFTIDAQGIRHPKMECL
jgi:serine/threonine-protein kinase